jgi:hypothetical protein
MEGVAPMVSMYTTQRPSMLLAPACAPSVVLPRHESVVITAALWAPLSQVDQVPNQAELAGIRVIGDGGSTGFVGIKGASVKGAASGVPPRGRPV